VDLSKFEWIDWDPEDDEDGNAAHCRRLGIPEQVVYEVLSEEPVEIKLPVKPPKPPSSAPTEPETSYGHCCAIRHTNEVTG